MLAPLFPNPSATNARRTDHQLSAYSPSTVAWISSTETCMMFLGGVGFGHVFESFGPRWLLLIGSVLHVLGLTMVSISSAYYHFFLAQALCSALAASAIFYACTGAVSTWFRHRRATAFGIVSSGASLGGVIFPIMAATLIPQLGQPAGGPASPCQRHRAVAPCQHP